MKRQLESEFPDTDRRDLGGIGAILLASAIWGASFVLAKWALAELAMTHVVLFRFSIAALFFLPWLLLSRAGPRRRDLPLFVLTGFLMVPVTFFLQFGGLALTSATNAALMIGTGTPLLALAAVLFEGERLGRRGWVAVAISCLGIVLLIGLPGAGSDWRGDLLVFVSMVVSAVWVLISKRLTGRYSALQATGWCLVFGTLFLIPASLVWSGVPPVTLSAGVWASLLGLGLGCTVVSFGLWNWGVARIGAGPAGVYLNIQPVVGAVIGILLLGEAAGPGIAIGGILIVAAAVMISAPARAAAKAEPERQPACPACPTRMAPASGAG